MGRLIHTMIRVFDLEKSIDFYARAFDLQPTERYDTDTFSLVFLKNRESEMEIELTWNKGRTEPYTPGDGFGHLAISIDNFVEEHQRLLEQGFSPSEIVEMKDGDVVGARLFFVQDPDGYSIEVLDRIGRLAPEHSFR